MAAVIDPFIFVLFCLIALVVWRWNWLREERQSLSRKPFTYNSEQFDTQVSEDEDDRTYSGKVIKRLRSHLIEGRVEVHWEFNPEFIHRGFVLSAKCRRNDGDWQPLAMEPYQDSGSWIECFNYGESRSYLFAVKKSYQFFFGLFGEAADEIVYDQISFSVRKGKYLKEKKELIRDRRELLGEVKEYVRAEQEIRQLVSRRPESTPGINAPQGLIEKLEKRRKAQSELADYLERETAKINADSSWSEERKLREIERLNEMVAEAKLEE